MDWQNYYVLALALGVIVLLVLEKAHLTVLGVALMIAVAIPGLIDPENAIAGLSSPALVTIGSLFIVGAGVLRTGAASILADKVLQRTGGSESTVILLVMVMSAVLSAFVNNTLVVITFLPVITSVCRQAGLFPSRLLIPLSYASIVGGMCTLVGTSTNLLVDGALRDHPDTDFRLSMFLLSPAGLILAGVAVLYLTTVGRHMLPKIPSLSTQMGGASVTEYVMEITIGKNSKLVGQPISAVDQTDEPNGARTMMVVRDEGLLWPPFADLSIQAGDILMVSGPIQELSQLQLAEARTPGSDADAYDPSTMSFFELAISPVSAWVGRAVGDVELKSQFGAAVVGVQRGGRHFRERVSTMTLHAGDVLLAFGDERSKTYLRHSSDFHLVEGVDESIHRTERAPVAFAIILGVVLLFVTGWVHFSTAALLGAFSMAVTGCLTVRQALNAVNWPIILFIAGMLALGKALDATGTTDHLAAFMLSCLPDGGWWLLLGTLVTTVVLTEFLTNNAVAVLMVPIALRAAEQASVAPEPIVVAVALGASCCFANPIGYQTNLLVLGPGGYRFRNFIKVGMPLDLILTATALVIIPWFWPL